jgi:hypothetical protein
MIDREEIENNSVSCTSEVSTYTSSAKKREVECRIEFVNIGEVDTYNEQFKAHVIIRSRWYEDGHIEQYSPEKYWNPKLFIKNLIPEKNYEAVAYKLIQFETNTEITEIRTCKGCCFFLINF